MTTKQPLPQPVPPAIAKIAPDGNLTPRQRRHFLIQMGLRRQKPGTGSSHEFMMRRTAVNPWPDLREVLKGIDWVLIDGVATRAYMPERVTKDMDILVETAGYKKVSRLAAPGYLMRSPDGVELDVLFGRYEWLEEALATRGSDPAGYPVIGLPYLIILKLAANRGRDIGDMTTMLGWVSSEEELDKVREAVARYSPEDRDDLESLIFMGKIEKENPSDNAQD
jgi:hypothetical protein